MLAVLSSIAFGGALASGAGVDPDALADGFRGAAVIALAAGGLAAVGLRRSDVEVGRHAAFVHY